ncbi:MAG: 3-deoxy-D-manno-octulosonic acid transferase [Alistipes sp.]|nr:3-deoxy-D-manno-octulosonic acid transferase [Alistipes sp.]
MGLLYNIGINIYEAGISLAAHHNHKAKLWRDGHKDLLEHIEQSMAGVQGRIVWLHAASLGEFEQGRPIIERIKELIPDAIVVLTFFSPSGYEIRKNYPGADHIFYLPSDTPSNVTRFINAVHPEVAIFVKYEFWLNYLNELRLRNIPTYLVSAIFRPTQIHFHPWGTMWRRALNTYTTIFLQDDASKELLHRVGYDRNVVAGDTRFDRVATIASAARRIPIVENFKGDGHLFVAGSTWGKDEELLIELINHHPDIRFVIAPHEMDEARMQHIEKKVDGGVARYTRSSDSSDFSNTQVLILDTIGLLSSLYGYARWAYIGGGFGVGIHNTLEAATFGLPIAFGPNYHKFREACDMIELGAACSISSYTELEAWFSPIKHESPALQKASSSARIYTKEHCGATDTIMSAIFPNSVNSDR